MKNFLRWWTLHFLAPLACVRHRRIWIWLLAVLRCPIFKTLNFNLYSAYRQRSHSFPFGMVHKRAVNKKNFTVCVINFRLPGCFLVSSSKWKRFFAATSSWKFPWYFVIQRRAHAHNIFPWTMKNRAIEKSVFRSQVHNSGSGSRMQFQLVHPNKLLTYWCSSEKPFSPIRHLLDRDNSSNIKSDFNFSLSLSLLNPKF